jgi:hypothetical protein
VFHSLYKLREKPDEIKRRAVQILGLSRHYSLASAMPDDDFEQEPKDPLISAVTWLYGLGCVAVGTFIYSISQSSRGGGQGFPLDWLIDPIRHWLGYK